MPDRIFKRQLCVGSLTKTSLPFSVASPWLDSFLFTDLKRLQVYVLRKCDDARNGEWWLIRKESGSVGFVPATYLAPLE